MELGESAMLATTHGKNKRMTHLKLTLLNQTKRGKVEYHLRLISRKKISVSSIKGRHT